MAACFSPSSAGTAALSTHLPVRYLSLIFAHGWASLKSAIGLSCLSVKMRVCPASNGEQAVAKQSPG